jgi:hypothetical protein
MSIKGTFNHMTGEIGNILTNNRGSAKAARTAWNRTMEASNTSWQRGVKDMELAGINPMLALSQGGASTPSASPSEVRASGGELVKAYTGWSGAQSARMMAEAQTQQVRNDAVLKTAQTSEATAGARDKNADAANKEAANPYVGIGKSTEVGEGAARIAEIGKRVEELAQTISQRGRMNPLDVDRLTAEIKSVKAGIPQKEFIGAIAGIANKALEKMNQSPPEQKRGFMDAVSTAINDGMDLIMPWNAKSNSGLVGAWEDFKARDRAHRKVH